MPIVGYNRIEVINKIVTTDGTGYFFIENYPIAYHHGIPIGAICTDDHLDIIIHLFRSDSYIVGQAVDYNGISHKNITFGCRIAYV